METKKTKQEEKHIYILEGTTRVEEIDEISAKIRSMCRGDKRKWVLAPPGTKLPKPEAFKPHPMAAEYDRILAAREKLTETKKSKLTEEEQAELDYGRCRGHLMISILGWFGVRQWPAKMVKYVVKEITGKEVSDLDLKFWLNGDNIEYWEVAKFDDATLEKIYELRIDFEEGLVKSAEGLIEIDPVMGKDKPKVETNPTPTKVEAKPKVDDKSKSPKKKSKKESL